MAVKPPRHWENATEGSEHAPRTRNLRLVKATEALTIAVGGIRDYAIFLLNPEGQIVSWNQGAARLKGYSESEILSRHFSIFYMEEDRQKGKPAFDLAEASRNGRFEDEDWRVRKDGSRFWASVVITAIRDESGELLGFTKITRDISQQKVAEQRRIEELRRAQAVAEARLSDFEAIFNAIPDPVVVTDLNRRIIRCNAAFISCMGYAPEELRGRSTENLYVNRSEYEATGRQYFNPFNGSRGAFTYEISYRRKNGETFLSETTATILRDHQGSPVGNLAIIKNITERKQGELRLRESEEQLKQALAIRDEFMSIASHELKTPVTSLKILFQSALRQLNKGDLRPLVFDQVRHRITTAVRQLDRMSRLIEDMLDVSRIATGRLVVQLQPVELETLVQEVVERFQPVFRSEGAELELTCPEKMVVKADRIRLEQIIANLLTNALKYGNGKPVAVSVFNDIGKACVSIRDQGIGIAPEDQSRIFERFERAIDVAEVSGFGLGLFISQELAKAHHGIIRVQSERGRGATFTLELPLFPGASS